MGFSTENEPPKINLKKKFGDHLVMLKWQNYELLTGLRIWLLLHQIQVLSLWTYNKNYTACINLTVIFFFFIKETKLNLDLSISIGIRSIVGL